MLPKTMLPKTMLRKIVVLLFIILMGAIALPVHQIAHAQEEAPVETPQPQTAKATITMGDPEVSGTVYFQEVKNDLTRINGEIKGLSRGVHGFHIHESGDLSEGCSSTGSHYNPFNTEHGTPASSDRHVGDLGNIYANSNGTAKFRMMDELVELSGEASVIGRAVVVHSGEDDLGRGDYPDSKTTGHAGGRVGCGLIE